jgi:hypothetical protein
MTLEQLSLFRHLALPLVQSMVEWAWKSGFQPVEDWVIQCVRRGMVQVRPTVWICVFGPHLLFEITATECTLVEFSYLQTTYATELQEKRMQREHWILQKVLHFGRGDRSLQLVMKSTNSNSQVGWKPFDIQDANRGNHLVFYQQHILGCSVADIQQLMQSYSSTPNGRMMIEKWLVWKLMEAFPSLPYSIAMMYFIG